MTYADLWALLSKQWPDGYLSLGVESNRHRDSSVATEWTCYRHGEIHSAATADQLWAILREDRAVANLTAIGSCNIMADEQ